MDYGHDWLPAVRILAIILVLCGPVVPVNNVQFNLPLQAIGKMAETFGQTIHEFASEVTALTDFRSDYLLMDMDIRSIDGQKLVKDMKHTLEKLFTQKFHAVQKLERKLEIAHKRHSFDPEIQISYPESKKLNVSEFELVRNEHFNNISVNLMMSTVHIPTNIYKQSADVLNGIAYTNALDEAFRKNFKDDHSLTWQYFCSPTGFFRLYPGTVWHRDRNGFVKPDAFDCRLRKWYIDAVASAKDVVILLDSSASMKEQNFKMARELTKLIVDTLTDSDYFNVITFSDVPNYVDPCSNRTLVHANSANKRRFTSALDRLKAVGSADHKLALTEAFDLLTAVNLTSRGSRCHRTILLVTEGVKDTYKEVFLKYNSPVTVRVFTYLIGNDNSVKAANMKAIACNNKDKGSLWNEQESERQEVPQRMTGHFQDLWLEENDGSCQDFTRVLSRPLILSRPDRTVWTNVYDDTVGLDLVLTVSRPVFSVRNGEGTQGGKFLGVVGADIKLSEIEEVFKQFTLGVGSYSFLITNNGYVVSHPDLRPKFKSILNPNHDVVNLWKLESSTKVHELTQRMLNRETSHMRMSSHVMYSDMNRIRSKDSNYFFTDIHSTPFSLAIVLPIPYGGNITEGKQQLRDFELSAPRSSEAVIAPWNYCKFTSHELTQNPLDILLKYLNDEKSGKPLYRERCNAELINSFLFDAEATRSAYSNWMKENWDVNGNDITALKNNGVELVFIGTKGGLTRFASLVDVLSDPEFIENHRSTIDSLYYTRAVDNGEEMFTFSLPFDAGQSVDLNKLVLTISSPIFVNRDGHEAVMAVVGLQMKYTKFSDLFMNGSQLCSEDTVVCRPCAKEEIDCYLLDFNGYVVLSEDPKELGQFYGELDGFASVIMNKLTVGDSERATGVFKRFQIDDHQSVCEILKKTNSGCHSAFVNPLKLLFNSVLWLIHELALLLLQFNFGLIPSYNADAALNATETPDVEMDRTLSADGEVNDGENFDSLVNRLLKVASVEQVYKWKDECIRKTPDGDLAILCLKDVLKMYEPGVIGYRPCVKSYTRYMASPMQLPYVQTVAMCDACVKSFSINLVPRTNLLLLAVDSVCYCDTEPVVSTNPVVESSSEDSVLCQTVQEEMHHSRPTPCFAHHKDENTDYCGHAASFLYPSWVVILQLLSTLVVTIFVC